MVAPPPPDGTVDGDRAAYQTRCIARQVHQPAMRCREAAMRASKPPARSG